MADDKPFRDALGELMFRLHMGAGSARPIDAWAQYGEPVIVPTAETIKEVIPTEVSEKIIAETIQDPTNKDSVQKALTIAASSPRTEALFTDTVMKPSETIKDTYANALSYLTGSSQAQPTHLQKLISQADKDK